MPDLNTWMSPGEAIERLELMQATIEDSTDFNEAQARWLAERDGATIGPQPIDQNATFSFADDFIALQKAIEALKVLGHGSDGS